VIQDLNVGDRVEVSIRREGRRRRRIPIVFRGVISEVTGKTQSLEPDGRIIDMPHYLVRGDNDHTPYTRLIPRSAISKLGILDLIAEAAK
jgi:hypothetical protein